MGTDLYAQLEAIQARISTRVKALASVTTMEELDDALETTKRLPCGVVVYSGDFPTQLKNGSQDVKRYWSVILVLELQRSPQKGLDIIQAVIGSCLGFCPQIGTGILTLAGARFVSKFDNTRVVYEVRFTHDAWLVINTED